MFLNASRSVVPPSLTITEVIAEAGRTVLVAKPLESSCRCPGCGQSSRRVHSHYQRRLADLPWHGRVIEIRLQARRFRCGNGSCQRKIFTERLAEAVQSRARRTLRLAESQRAIGLAAGGEPGSRLARKLAMPVSGDTILRLIRAANLAPITPPRVVGIDDWAWRRGQRYGTIICDLERNRVLDLLPDRNADTVAAWLKRHPGIEIVARDRAGVYADGARRGAPGAIQVADRWHLLRNLGDNLRNVVGRHRRAIAAAGRAVLMAKTAARAEEGREAARSSPTTLDELRETRRHNRREAYAQIRRLREQGLTPSRIAPIVGMDKRSVQRWLMAGGEPEHHRRSGDSHIIDPFRNYLGQRWQEGCQIGEQLWREIKEQGFGGSRVTVARWAAAYRERASSAGQAAPIPSIWKVPSRRRCARLLSHDRQDLDADEQAFLVQLFELAPELEKASDLARRFEALLRGNDDAELDPWIVEAETSELAGLAKGMSRDIDAVRAAITQPWTTSPVEGQINRVKAIKRQMYGRAHYPLLRQRVLIAA